jgi:KUP system potassium uptake protein
MVPVWAVIPVVGLAAFATVVASQAVISGIFSLSWQAIQLGYIPRRLVVHTSHHQQGHVYIPTINYLMLILTLLVIVFFRQSHHLSTAYGITVNGIMMMTTILFGLVAHYVWKWNVIKTTLLIGSFLTLDMLFFGVNILKVVEGGWLPLLIAFCAFMTMNTWVKGIQLLRKEESKSSLSMNDFLRKIKLDPPIRMPGTSIYMSSTPGTVPLSLATNLKQYYCLSENVIFLSIITKKASRLLDTNKSNFYLQHLGKNIYEVKSYYGYMEVPDVTQIFEKMCEAGLNLQIYKSSFVFSRNLPILSPKVYGLNRIEKRLFAFLAKHTLNPADFYKIPYSRVIELGVRYQI